MKLIGALTSPYVRKVRVVMAEKKLDFQLVLEDVWNSDAILASNPLGKVPCLVMEGGEAVFDSRVIVEYLDTLSPVGKLIPPSGRERTEVRTWEALADGVLDAAVAARLEQTWPGRTAEQRSAAWVERQMQRVHAALKAMGQGLGLNAAFSNLGHFANTPNALAFRASGASPDDSVTILGQAWYQAAIPLPFLGFKPYSRETLELTFGKMDIFGVIASGCARSSG